MINSRQLLAGIEVRRSELTRLQNDLRRREVLGAQNVIGKEELQHAREAVVSAKAQLDVATEQFNANKAVILDTPLSEQPAVKQAATEVRNAGWHWSGPISAARWTVMSPGAVCRSVHKSPLLPR